MNKDTVMLLREIDAGCKTATDSICQVKGHVKDKTLTDLFNTYEDRHAQIGDQCQTLLASSGFEDKEPNPAGKLFMELSTGVRLGANSSVAKCADLIAEGCAMGIRSAAKYRNQYPASEQQGVDLANQLISTGQAFLNDLLPYL